jgi:hypothetical protein
MHSPGARAALLLGVCALTGCGGASPSEQVRAKVEQFGRAAAQRDYTQICTQVLATTLLERLAATGTSCPGLMQVALEGVQRPILSIGKIRVSGASAQVVTLSVAAGQPAALAEIDLVHESSGWRISALGSSPAKLFSSH